MKHLLTLNKYFLKYKWRFILGFVFVTVSNLFGVYSPQIVRFAIDLINETFQSFVLIKGFSVQNDLAVIFTKSALILGLVYIAMALLKGIFMFFMRQTLIVMSRLIEFDQKNEIYDQYQLLDLSFYKKNNTGDLMNRISEDVSRVRMYLGPAIMYTINLVVMIVLVIVAMLAVNPKLTLYVLLPLPLMSFLIYNISERINRESDKVQKQLSNISTFVQEVFSGIRVIKAFNREKFTQNSFYKTVDSYKNKQMNLVQTNAFFMPAMTLLVGLSTILTIFIGGLEAIKGNITVGNIAEFVIYVNLLTWPMASLGWVSSLVQRAEASQARINEFLDEKPQIVSPNNEDVHLKGKIEFKNVSFTYPESGTQALKNVSFEVNPGETLAIIGRTGSGKSTIANLMVRLFDVKEGEILMDGNNIQNLNLDSIRKQTGYVPQEVFLFSETIAENIAFGEPTIAKNDKRITDAAINAHIHHNIIDFKEGYETLVGERGITLSGGQKQRISIARAIIKNPEILIFDDCLSAVDTETEEKILNNLNQIMANKTTIIISHRVSSIRNASRILVLEHGEIIESGSHEELINLKGNYFEIYQKQLLEDKVESAEN